MKAQPFSGTHAIVVGGSVVGSIVAAILARRFDRVTMIERDKLPERPDPRAGVPQGHHVHALLSRGAIEIERLFPGFLDEMKGHGAQLIDVGRDAAWLTPAGWGVPFESGFLMCCATRNLIEWQVRRRALTHPNVRLLERRTVDALTTDAARSRVTGVRVRSRDAEATVSELTADLVVDTTGRGSQLQAWLAATGRSQVRELVVDAHMAYASRFFAVASAAFRGWQAAYVQAALPHARRGGILFPVEGGRCHLTLFGYGDGAPPTDEAGFRDFVENLRHPVLADILRRATPLTPIVAHRRTENRWRRFDEARDWPEGLIALGDSCCCFDPVYGQGITTGVLSALQMSHRIDLESGVARPGFARRVQRDLVSVVRPAWNLATGEDLRLEATTGGRLRRIDRLMQRYVDRVIAASTHDAGVRRQLLSVMNMVAGPETLLRPTTLVRVVAHCLARRTEPQDVWDASATQAAAQAPPRISSPHGVAALHGRAY